MTNRGSSAIMSSTSFSISARWIFPVSSPPISRGKIFIEEGRIVGIEANFTQKGDFDFSDHLLIPGLVNSHTHLDLSSLRGKILPTLDFIGWLKQVIAHRRTQTPEMIYAAIQEGIEALQRSGTMLVGDINVGGTSWDLLTKSSLNSVLFWEMIGLQSSRAEQVSADHSNIAHHLPVETC